MQKKFLPENLLRVYKENGREGLVDLLCVFDETPTINKLMEEMIDDAVLVFSGKTPVSVFVENMEIFNAKFYDAICDEALDMFSNGEISAEVLKQGLDELQDTKANLDELEKNAKDS
jgi:hypothetical protein